MTDVQNFSLLSRLGGLRDTRIATRVTVNGHLLLLASSPSQSSRATCQPKPKGRSLYILTVPGKAKTESVCTGYGADTHGTVALTSWKHFVLQKCKG